MTAHHKAQLTKKIQLAHFMASNCKSFKNYAKFVNFEKKHHDVDLGSSYLNEKSAAEMVKYISISKRITGITEPFNNGELNYYSVCFDGSSTAKTVDEKELFVIKFCQEGVPKYQVMSLEEPSEANSAGLKEALSNSVNKMGFNFSRNDKEIGMCTDSAAVNRALHRLLLGEFGD